MRKLLGFLLITVFASTASARVKYQDFASQGAVSVPALSAGPTSVLKVCPGATLAFYTAGTSTLRTVYTNADGTGATTTISADGSGRFRAYLDDGIYDIVQTGGGCSNRTYSDVMVYGETLFVNIKGRGALCNGTTDDTLAIQSAYDLSASGQPITVAWPAATCKFTNTINISTRSTRTYGVGSYASNALFVPTSGGLPAFKAASGTSSPISNIEFRGLRLYSTDTTLQKIGFEIVDGSFIIFDDIAIGPEEMWKGAGTSIGIKLRGRELINIRNCSIWANDGVALSIQPNPNDVRDGDYLIVQNTVLSGDKTANTTQPVIAALSNTQITRSAFRDINMSYGGWGFYWVDNASATSSDGLEFSHFFWEQSKNASGVGELIRIDKTGSSKLYNFTCKHCGVGGVQLPNGIYLRSVDQAQIDQLFVSSSSTGVPLNVSTTNGLTLRNQFLQTNSSNIMTNMRRVGCKGRAEVSATAACSEEVWESTANTNLKESFVIWDTPFYTETGTLAPGASTPINMVGGTLKVGRIAVEAKGPTILASGTVSLASTRAALLDAGINFDDADTPNNLCVIWSSASVANLKNNTAESLDYAFVIWYRK